MGDTAYSVWYRIGTVAVTKNSKNVTGTSTYWLSSGINPGDMFSVDHGSTWLEIASITDGSHLTLKTAYTGNSGTELEYAVVRNFNSGMGARVSAEAAQLLGYFDTYINNDMKSIHGKSAYEVAVQNGYTGTQTQWLESLKAAGEWSNASTRLTTLETQLGEESKKITENTNAIGALTTLTGHWDSKKAEVRNSVIGFRDLGTEVTAEQKAALKGTFKGLGIGDYWTINGHKYQIAKFLSHVYGSNSKGTMMLSDILYAEKMNETDTNEGGYYNSYMATDGLKRAEEILTADWGDMLKTFNECYPKTNATGARFWGQVLTKKCMIPTFVMMMGREYAPYPQSYYNYLSNTQLPLTLFEQYKGVIGGVGKAGADPVDKDDEIGETTSTGSVAAGYWLQECANGTDSFCAMGSNGPQLGRKASGLCGVRVIFILR